MIGINTQQGESVGLIIPIFWDRIPIGTGKVGYSETKSQNSETGTGFLILLSNKHYSLDPLSIMLKWSIILLVVAIIAGVLGFGGVAAGAAGIAKILFFVFIVLFVVSLIFGKSRL